MSTNGSAFWDYTLALYGRPGVSPAVIGLQDRRGADVNLLLCCCWAAADGRGALDDATLARMDAAVDPWRCAVTRPLRAIRDLIRNDAAIAAIDGAMDTRKKVLGAEIDSERVAQGLMQALVPPAGAGGEPLADAATALVTCCARLGFVPAGDDLDGLVTLLGAAFEQAGEAAARQALERAIAG